MVVVNKAIITAISTTTTTGTAATIWVSTYPFRASGGWVFLVPSFTLKKNIITEKNGLKLPTKLSRNRGYLPHMVAWVLVVAVIVVRPRNAHNARGAGDGHRHPLGGNSRHMHSWMGGGPLDGSGTTRRSPKRAFSMPPLWTFAIFRNSV